MIFPKIDGEILEDNINRILYSTDASVYRELPLAVVIPRSDNDIKKIIDFARNEKLSVIPRTAGTSLAGQCVGNGIVVDISKHFNQIIELNVSEHWVRLQPGVILSELNKYLEPYSLFFGPETSTANRCMIGGMVGNNSCGLHSLVYGSTREHTLEIKAFLSDGSEAVFKPLSLPEFNDKCSQANLEGSIYRSFKDILDDAELRKEINDEFPLKTIPRRNTGYALDLLLDDYVRFSQHGSNHKFNFCKLLCGSEGTLAFTTEIKLNLVPLSKLTKALLCVHLNSVEEAIHSNLIALKHNPTSVELTDGAILELTKANIEQSRNRFFVKGDPGAILIIEIEDETIDAVRLKSEMIIKDLQNSGYGYHFPLIFGNDMSRVWNLRNAGLGILANMPGDAKPQAVVEDTAVDVYSLHQFYLEFEAILKRLGLTSTYYAHIGTGEIHIRPIINLKTKEGVRLFREVALQTAHLVKKFKGSLSGEHGDGRLRGEFIRIMYGDNIYNVFRRIKHIFDPYNVFNPSKIVDTPPMDTSLRFDSYLVPDTQYPIPDTIMDFFDTNGLLPAIEKCNGTADCRKSVLVGGIMCPSYMATKDEMHSTRARANILREFYSGSADMQLTAKDCLEVLDLCLSCKGCKSECPSNIDMAAYKAEFLQKVYDNKRPSLRTLLFAYITQINKYASRFPFLYNTFTKAAFLSKPFQNIIGVTNKRKLPSLNKYTLTDRLSRNPSMLISKNSELRTNNSVILYIDEFLQFNDVQLGIKAVKLLAALGYNVKVYDFRESGRTFISKGMLRKAKSIANENISYYKDKVKDDTPLIGIEPSAILTFRDEYLRLADNKLKADAVRLSKNCFLIDEFLSNELKSENIKRPANLRILESANLRIMLHGHCHQRVLASIESTKYILSELTGFDVELVPSGCCGMAGSFGYEKEHYDVSMKIGELVLFPSVRKQSSDTIISAPGTSCRQQIFDGTGRKALHPVEIIYDILM